MAARVFLLLLIAGLAVPVLAPGRRHIANAASARPPVLAGKTTVIGDTTTGMRVTLPRRVTLDADSGPNPDIKIRGDGRLTGVILTEDVGEFYRSSLEAVRFGFCREPGCSPADRSMQYLFKRRDSEGGKVVLEPGSYLLYLIADQASVTVQLRLHGLTGSTVLKPHGKVDSGFVLPNSENATGSPGDQAFWYGEEIDIRGRAGYLIAVLRMDLDDWVNVHWGDCAYDVTPPPRPTAYSPLCPAGFNVFQNEGAVLAKSEFVRPIMSEIGAGGRFGYGLYYTAAADISNAYSSFFHLSLDPQLP